MQTCPSESITVGFSFAKSETFPIWNLPLKHPVNVAYKVATADLSDVNMIDQYHLEANGETTVNIRATNCITGNPWLINLQQEGMPAACHRFELYLGTRHHWKRSGV